MGSAAFELAQHGRVQLGHPLAEGQLDLRGLGANNTLIIVVTADVYTANSLEGKAENVIQKTYGINKFLKLATDHINPEEQPASE